MGRKIKRERYHGNLPEEVSPNTDRRFTDFWLDALNDLFFDFLEDFKKRKKNELLFKKSSFEKKGSLQEETSASVKENSSEEASSSKKQKAIEELEEGLERLWVWDRWGCYLLEKLERAKLIIEERKQDAIESEDEGFRKKVFDDDPQWEMHYRKDLSESTKQREEIKEELYKGSKLYEKFWFEASNRFAQDLKKHVIKKMSEQLKKQEWKISAKEQERVTKLNEMTVGEFEKDLNYVRKRMEKDLYVYKTRWQQAKEWAKPILVVIFAEVIRQCGSSWVALID